MDKASVIKEHHISIKFQTPYIDEELSLSCEEVNVNDKRAVTVRKLTLLLLMDTHLERCHVSSGFSCNTEVPVKAFFAPIGMQFHT